MSNAKQFSSVSRHLKVRSYQRKSGVIGSVIGVLSADIRWNRLHTEFNWGRRPSDRLGAVYNK